MKEDLFREFKLGSKVSKNRFVRSATNDHLSDPDGMLTEEQIYAMTDTRQLILRMTEYLTGQSGTGTTVS